MDVERLQQRDDFLRLDEVLEVVGNDDGHFVTVELVAAVGDEVGVGCRSQRRANGQLPFLVVEVERAVLLGFRRVGASPFDRLRDAAGTAVLLRDVCLSAAVTEETRPAFGGRRTRRTCSPAFGWPVRQYSYADEVGPNRRLEDVRQVDLAVVLPSRS